MNEPRSARRRWVQRVLAILLGVSPLVLAEIGLRIAGLGRPATINDPYVSWAATRPLFERTPGGDRFEIPAARQPLFKPDSFAANKPKNGFRIFCLGGSTVQGNPYSIETSFTTWLELSLQAADPARTWEVVNCGGISYASYRLEPILRECLAYQPDLIVLYVGDNEFLEERSFAHLKNSRAWLKPVVTLLSRFHLYHYGRQAWRGKDSQRGVGPTALTAEVETLLDYEGGLAEYHRDDTWRSGVADHFQFALSSMLAHASKANVPVLIMDPVSNIKDCPPFKVENDPQLSAEQHRQVVELLTAPEDTQADRDQHIDRLEAARAVDPRHAGVLYQLGRAYLASGRIDDAREALFQAKDEDVCPLRMTEPLREITYQLSRQFQIPIVPVLAEFSARSPFGIPGDELLLDHVHPTISGHQLIADQLLRSIVESGWVQPKAGWELKRQQLYQDHLATLDAPYYARGQEHLEGLRRWAHGRVTKRPFPSP
jgi:hypothetical protein